MDIFTLLDAAAECLSPGQYESLQDLLTSDGAIGDKNTPGDRLARCIAKRMASQTAAAAGQEAVAIPAGWTLVPAEPTDALLRPFYDCPQEELHDAWHAMLWVAGARLRSIQNAAPLAQPATLALTDEQRRQLFHAARNADNLHAFERVAIDILNGANHE